jgi:hypothetical protein
LRLAHSFDHLVHAANHRQRDGEAERLGGLHVDDGPTLDGKTGLPLTNGDGAHKSPRQQFETMAATNPKFKGDEK